MNNDKQAFARIRRMAPFAQTLVLALTLGAGGAAAAQPGQATSARAALSPRTTSLSTAATRGQSAQAAAMSAPNTPASTVNVINCSGADVGGSLVDAVENAQSGDIIDMSLLSCTTIELDATLVIPQDNLILLGQTTFYGFVPAFDIVAPNGYRGIHHTGTGTLELRGIKLSGGHVATSGTGACILSSGNVTLNTAWVNNCTAETAASSTTVAKGGAIAASGDVLLTDLSSVHDSSAIATQGAAYGGGIWAGGKVELKQFSIVRDNRAESSGGEVKGGGIYATVWADVYNSDVVDNTAHVSTNGLFAPNAYGGGIYSAADSWLDNATIDGNAVTSASSLNVADGGGVYTETGVYPKDGTEITGNHADNMGGGLYTNGQLNMKKSTVMGNDAPWGAGAMYVAGNVHMDQSTIAMNTSNLNATIQLGESANSTMTIWRSTISDNEVLNQTSNGAALFLQHDAEIEHCSIVYNESYGTDPDVGKRYGSGISLGNDVSVYLWNTLVSGNGMRLPSGGLGLSDIGLAQGTSGGQVDPMSNYNLVNWPLPSIQMPNTWSRGWPQMGPLQDNGGPTWTHLPDQGSYMVDAGSAGTSTIDQRGLARVAGTYADIGAVELTEVELDRIFANDFE